MLNIKEFTNSWKEDLKERVDKLDTDIVFDIYQLGDNPASNRYVRNKMKDCEAVGIKACLMQLSDATTTETLCNYIDYSVENNASAIMLQLPVPDQINLGEVIKHIPPKKDVDGFRTDSYFDPCTPKGIITYLNAIGFDYDGKLAVVLGRSEIVGKPVARMLQDRNCTVAQCNSHTPKELRNDLLSKADVVICAVGKQNFISSKDAPNAIIVDVGINFNEEGKMCGDVHIEEGDEDRVTPVPGGVGLLTRTALLDNILEAADLEKFSLQMNKK